MIPRRRADWLLIGVLLVALVPRLYHLRRPILDNHSFRQTVTAMQSYLYYREGNPLWVPKTVSGRGGSCYLPEFPIYSWLVALCYRVNGVHEYWGRLVGIAFALLAVVYFHRLAAKYFPRGTSLLAALLFAVCPLFIFYSRCFIRQGGLSLFLCAAMVYEFTELVDRGGARAWCLTALWSALALAVNPPGAYVAVPMAVYLASVRGRGGFGRKSLWALAAAVALAAAAWFAYHTLVLNQGQYSPTFYPGRASFRAWFSPAYYVQWVDVRFLQALYRYLVAECLAPLGAVFAAAGLVLLFFDGTPGAKLFIAWLAAAFIYSALDSYPFFVVPHEYYALAFAPPIALLFARGLAGAASLVPSRAARAILVAAVVCASWTSAWGRVLATYYPVNWPLYRFVEDARPLIPGDALVFTCFGGPEALYYAHRYGWWQYRPGDDALPASEAVARMERLRKEEGLRYVLFNDLRKPYDEVIARYLAGHELLLRYAPPGSPGEFLLYRLLSQTQ